MQESRRRSGLEFKLLPLVAGGAHSAQSKLVRTWLTTVTALGLALGCSALAHHHKPGTSDAGDPGESAVMVDPPAQTETPRPPEDRGPMLHSSNRRHVAPQGAGQAGPIAPLPEGTTVLHVGDSFAGALGIALNKRFKDAGVRGVLKYRTASYIVEWAHQHDLDTYVMNYQPDLVLISLGANELEITEPERRIPAIKKIVSKVGDRPCVWVGVPLWDGAHNGLMEIVRDNAAPCRFMDSTALFPDMPRAHDRIHPTMQAREDWAAKVADWLARQRRPTQSQAWALAGP